MTSKTNAREYLVSKGFTPGKRGRFTSEMLKVLKESGLEFTRPIRDPKVKGSSNSVPLA